METFFVTFYDYMLIGFIIFLGQFVYSAIGFASGMVTISLLALIYGKLSYFIPFFILLRLPTELTIAYKSRKSINFRTTFIFILAIFPAIILGSYLLKVLSDNKVVVFLGILIVLIALYYMFLEDKLFLTLRGDKWIIFFGFLSGLLGSLYGIGGPPLVFYFKNKRYKKEAFRSAMITLFLAMSIIRIPTYFFWSLYSMKIVYSCIAVTPFTLLGLYLGLIMHKHISEEQFKYLTCIVLLCSGVLLFVNNV